MGVVDVPSDPPPDAVELLLLSFSTVMGLQCNPTPSKYIKMNPVLSTLGEKRLLLKRLSFFLAVSETTTNKMKTVM